MSAGTSDNNNAMKLMEERKKVVDLLRDDLLKQYETPMQLNWDLYDDNITFDDPSTTLSGKTMYKVCYAQNLYSTYLNMTQTPQ